jgi:hypothetical protein
MIMHGFKITPAEAERTYETLVGMFNKDSGLPTKVARGYLDLREIPGWSEQITF